MAFRALPVPDTVRAMHLDGVHLPWIALGGAALLAVGGALLLASPGGPAEPSEVRVPPVLPGSEASYDATGSFRTLANPSLVTTKDVNLSGEQALVVSAREGPLPTAGGGTEPAVVLEAAKAGEGVFLATAADGSGPFLEVVPARFDPFEGEPPLARVDYGRSLGALDTFLYANRTGASSDEVLTDLSPWARESWHPLRRAQLEDRVAVEPLPEAPNASLRLTVHVEVSAPDGDRDRGSERVGDTIVVTPKIAENVTVSYDLSEDCPFPARARYQVDGSIVFHAERRTCQPGQDPIRTQATSARPGRATGPRRSSVPTPGKGPSSRSRTGRRSRS